MQDNIIQSTHWSFMQFLPINVLSFSFCILVCRAHSPRAKHHAFLVDHSSYVPVKASSGNVWLVVCAQSCSLVFFFRTLPFILSSSFFFPHLELFHAWIRARFSRYNHISPLNVHIFQAHSDSVQLPLGSLQILPYKTILWLRLLQRPVSFSTFGRTEIEDTEHLWTVQACNFSLQNEMHQW